MAEGQLSGGGCGLRVCVLFLPSVSRITRPPSLPSEGATCAVPDRVPCLLVGPQTLQCVVSISVQTRSRSRRGKGHYRVGAPVPVGRGSECQAR